MTEIPPSNQTFEYLLQRLLQSLPPPEADANFNCWQSKLEEMDRKYAEGLAKMKEDSDRLDKKLKDFPKWVDYCERASFNRSLNGIVRDKNSLVYPMPLPNGGYPAEGTFPETLGDFLSLDARALKHLLKLYELPHEEDVADARKALACHCYIPPSVM
ncbi:hypothetical protein RSOLAG22IIIB_11941 [Rhizoctonia solani]|uniref:Uncharacterized protein n=1 Tax=Rhizoctonia solani TaxID=456999 RepID=A0A0K6GBG0_9AGAM|nr:hypothetical protein RSOLAG22IIIB_11941 [Rhizoctonia solani]